MAYPKKITETSILAAARLSLEHDGGLSLKGVARRLRVKPPSLYRYYPSIIVLRGALAAEGFRQIGGVMRAALAREATLESLALSFRRFAVAHPRLYHLMHAPVTETGQNRAAREEALLPLLDLTGLSLDNPEFIRFQRIVWAFVHGFIALEQSGHFVAGGNLDIPFRAGIRTLAASLKRP